MLAGAGRAMATSGRSRLRRYVGRVDRSRWRDRERLEALVGRVGTAQRREGTPVEELGGSVVGRPVRSKMSPSGISSPAPAATRTICIATTVVAISRTTDGWRFAGR